jgi:hypothetical protein
VEVLIVEKGRVTWSQAWKECWERGVYEVYEEREAGRAGKVSEVRFLRTS